MGGYSFLITAIVIALVVVVNIVVSALPANLTKFDTTSEGLFSISGQTQELVSSYELHECNYSGLDMNPIQLRLFTRLHNSTLMLWK